MESWVRIGYPRGVTKLATFGQCRWWSRKNRQRRVKTKKIWKDCRGLIVLQTQLAFFLGSGSKKVILGSFKIKRNLLLNDVKVLNRAKESEANTQSSWSKTFLTLSVIHLHFQPTTAFFSEQKKKIIADKHLLSGWTGKKSR